MVYEDKETNNTYVWRLRGSIGGEIMLVKRDVCEICWCTHSRVVSSQCLSYSRLGRPVS